MLAAAAADLPDRRRKERSPLPTRNGSRSACTNANRGERGSRQVGEGREGRSRWGTFARGTDDAEPGLPLRPPSAGGRPPAPADQRGAAARLRPGCRAPFRPGARLCVNFDCFIRSTFGCPSHQSRVTVTLPRPALSNSSTRSGIRGWDQVLAQGAVRGRTTSTGREAISLPCTLNASRPAPSSGSSTLGRGCGRAELSCATVPRRRRHCGCPVSAGRKTL